MAKVIICFEKRNQPAVIVFSRALKSAGHQVWLESTSTSLDAAESDQRDAAWQAADVCVFVLGLDSMQTQAMRHSFAAARHLNKPRIPVVIEPQLDVETLRPGAYINATGNLHDAAIQLVGAVNRLTADAPAPSKAHPRSLPAAILTAAGVLFLLGMLGLLLASRTGDSPLAASLPTIAVLPSVEAALPVVSTVAPAGVPPSASPTPDAAAKQTDSPLTIAENTATETDTPVPAVITEAVTLTPTALPPTSSPILSSLLVVTLTETPHAAMLPSPTRVTVSLLYPPRAQFSLDPAQGNMPLTVRFTNESRGRITGYRWDFNGDGITDSTADSPPNQVFDRPGLYYVILIASGPGGDSTPYKKVILVRAPTRTPTLPPSPLPPMILTSTPPPTASFTPIPSLTSTPTATRTPTHSPTPTATDTPTHTATWTATFTPTETAALTTTLTDTPTFTPTLTNTPTPTDTPTLEPVTEADTDAEPGE